MGTRPDRRESRPARRGGLFPRLARRVREIFGATSPRWEQDDDTEDGGGTWKTDDDTGDGGGTGTREPRNPHPPMLSGASSLPLPREPEDVQVYGRDDA